MHLDTCPNKIILIRHAESQDNEKNKNGYSFLSGRHECSLNEHGKVSLSDIVISEKENYKIYSSPAKRCVETAKILFPHQKINISSFLQERSLGVWEGKSLKEIAENNQISSEFINKLKDPSYRHSFTQRLPTAENYVDVEKRCWQFFNENKDSQNIIIVSHFVTIRCILKIMLNMTEDETLNVYIPNATPIYLQKGKNSYSRIK